MERTKDRIVEAVYLGWREDRTESEEQYIREGEK